MCEVVSVSRVNGRRPPTLSPLPQQVEPKKIGCGKSLGGYMDQSVPDRCGAVGLDGLHLCSECHQTVQDIAGGERVQA